jgi:hypothetical protein
MGRTSEAAKTGPLRCNEADAAGLRNLLPVNCGYFGYGCCNVLIPSGPGGLLPAISIQTGAPMSLHQNARTAQRSRLLVCPSRARTEAISHRVSADFGVSGAQCVNGLCVASGQPAGP